MNAAVHSPLEKLGMIGLGNKSPQQLDDYVKSGTRRWAEVIKEPNLAGTH